MGGQTATQTAKDQTTGRIGERSQASARHIAGSGPHADVLDLQHAAGNLAVSQLVQSSPTASRGHDVPPIVHSVLNTSGQPLDPATRTSMESRFGHDFSRVRVHTDIRAAESARAVDALAYTVGRDVVLSAEHYTPCTRPGSKLLAHELAHVIQQERGGASPPPLQGGALERHADAAASAFVSSCGAINVSGASAAGLARQPVQKEKRRLREMLNLDPAKPQERQLAYELDLIENLLAPFTTQLTDTLIVEKAMELHKNSGGKVGGAVLAYYDRMVTRAVGGMLAQAAAPVVVTTDPSGRVEVIRAGQLALAHKKLQMDTALNLIEGFVKAGAISAAAALAGGLLMLAAAAAPAVFGAYASVSTMSAEAVTALALRLAPKLMAWATSNPVVAQAIVTTVASTVLEVAETGSVDPMGVVFNLLHVQQTRLQIRTPTPAPPVSPPVKGFRPPTDKSPAAPPTPAPAQPQTPSPPVKGFRPPGDKSPPTPPTPPQTPSPPVKGFRPPGDTSPTAPPPPPPTHLQTPSPPVKGFRLPNKPSPTSLPTAPPTQGPPVTTQMPPPKVTSSSSGGEGGIGEQRRQPVKATGGKGPGGGGDEPKADTPKTGKVEPANVAKVEPAKPLLTHEELNQPVPQAKRVTGPKRRLTTAERQNANKILDVLDRARKGDQKAWIEVANFRAKALTGDLEGWHEIDLLPHNPGGVNQMRLIIRLHKGGGIDVKLLQMH